MERLTERTAVGILVKEDYGKEVLKTLYSCYGEKPNPHYTNCEEGYCAMEKLADYEDAEEQGRLVKLPCKVGDTVWQIMVVGVKGKNIKYGIFKAVVTTISVDYQMNFLLSTITEDEERYRNEVTSTAIGETMFFTKSEAEAKLKELRGEKNGSME